MKIEDCELNPAGISMAPFVLNEPETPWITARDSGLIPLPLFDLYRRANYLSFGSAPPFLRDGDNILFSYFGLMMRSLLGSLTDADSDTKKFLEADKETYYPGRHTDDPTWTREKSEATGKRATEAFRSLLMSLNASLDSLSELIAIFSQGAIKNLEVGRSQFTSIEAWLKDTYQQPSLIATPRDVYLDALHTKLHPLVHCAPPESDWLPYMRLLRNKAAHLGDGPFRSSVLRGKDGGFYRFIPREWPYIWEKHMKPAGYQHPVPMPDLLRKTLIHQDVSEYAQGALRKVLQIATEAQSQTAHTYTDFSGFAFNQTALEELTANSKEFAFERFV